MIVKALIILILLGVLCACGLAGAVQWRATVCREVHPADCLIVLGARVNPSGEMSRTLRLRCERALEAHSQGLAENIICCGGQGEDEPAPEGRVMREYFISKGVPGEHVFAEIQSVNTSQNLENARKIMEEHGWRTAILVTSDYHVERALWLAGDAGLNACGLGAPTPDVHGVRVLSRLREGASWILYLVRKAL